jgi:hypothetical protein
VTQTSLSSGLDLDRLLRLRLTVARHGEMDAARWWNSKGMLGRYGAVVLKRGFPSTHYFAQARVVFAVARHRCAELFDPPGCMTLWHLPPELEDQFEERWQTWLDEAERWTPFFEELAGLQGDDLLDALKRFDLLSPEQFESARTLRRSLDGRALHSLGWLARAPVASDVWQACLLWHIGRVDTLYYEFAVDWLFQQFQSGIYLVRTEDCVPFVQACVKRQSRHKRELSEYGTVPTR